MKKSNLVMKDFNINGTCLRGYLPLGTTYKQIVNVFGKPSKIQDCKVKAQWIGKINDKIFTIYDYKSNVAKEQNTDWHIGGKDNTVTEMVIEYFKSV